MYLNIHSVFSFKYGTLTIPELIHQAVEGEVATLCLTDINNTSASFPFVKECIKNGIKPLIGIEFRKDGKYLYTGIAKNNQGFAELNTFLSRHNIQKVSLPERAPHFEHVIVIYPYSTFDNEILLDYEYLGVRVTDLNRLSQANFKEVEKLLIFQPVTFQGKVGFNTHRLLRAIDKNTLLSKLTPQDCAQEDESMCHISELISLYSRFPKLIQNTQEIINKCSINLDGEVKNKISFTGSRKDDKPLLEKLALDGLEFRYGKHNKIARARVMKELNIINTLDFNAYFLITWDILRYAQSRNFWHVGRGSGANSIVAYCLKITDVDPIELDLYFERFLNPYRTSPPDFDIDFSWQDRDEMTDYIFKRYGNKHTALLATYVTFRGRSIIRELGKVFGLPKPEIDLLVRLKDISQLKQGDRISRLILRYARELQDKPNYLSVHAGGILISEQPISNFTAVDFPPKGFPLVHFDMFGAEDYGFYKYDVLSQRGLGSIKDGVKIVKENTGKVVDLDFKIAKVDEKVRENIRKGNTIGCFYIESPAMRMLLKKLKCSDYLTLVAASSIIRPGVSASGMMQEYIKRFHDPSCFTYLHPKMEELLKETYGVMVYQEDVIKVAHHWAGLDLAEADILRRAMSGKYRGKEEIKRIEDKFYTLCQEKGHDLEISKEVWRQIESFSGYSFSKAHSASFAVESYQSLLLKTYYPLEFIVAVINNFGGFYNMEFYVQEARKNGAHIHAPCVNNSTYLTCIKGKTIYLGFVHLKSLEQSIAHRICHERESTGLYKSLEDFTRRIPIGPEQLHILIRINAFRFTGIYKKNLLWEASQFFISKKTTTPNALLFEEETMLLELPVLEKLKYENHFDEIELLGFPICFPFDLLPPKYNQGIRAKDMMENKGRYVNMVGYFIEVKDTTTKKSEHMSFAFFIDANGDGFDTTHFPDYLKRNPFQGRGFYLMKGKVAVEFDYPSIEVQYMKKLPIVNKEEHVE